MAEESSRVLVVDDERFFREAICDALRDASIDYFTADREEGAFELAMRPEVGAVILDIGAPGAGGLDLLRRLIEERPGLRVIVLSAQVDHDRVLEALRIGACDYLAKPLHNEELVLAVRRALLGSGIQASWESLCSRLAALESQLEELESESEAGESGSALADRMALAVADVLGVSRASLMLLEDDSGLLRVAGATGCDVEPADMDPVEVGSGVAGRVLEAGKALAVSDIGEYEGFADRVVDGRYRSGAFAVAPLKGDGRPIGVLCATERGDGGVFGSEDLSLLQIMALQVGPLIARWRNRDKAQSAARADRAQVEAQIAADRALEVGLPAADGGVADDAELARAICDVLTSEVEPDRVIRGSLAVVASGVSAAPVSLYLLRSNGRELVLESQCERAGQADREKLPVDSGLTGVVVQSGRLVATDEPGQDPRFDPEVDTPEGGEATAMLCIPISFRNKTMGVMRAFLEPGVSASARTGEILAATMSAAVRNALLHRGLLDCVDEIAKARKESRPQG
ncbi:MAG: GAF domain-containing protein [Deltaproteobacteria bacterium]|jgi:DNA-binding NarL/FixJ family response regulator|nr:GAF domain-containing protein [Deltaproteobacteria bacterium]